jgi:hypothetical protein
MNDGNAKQQIVEKIKSNSNILVTVSNNPSVDELSAALGMTLLLNKMNKHATAVFSGAIPPAIAFLDPQKTFENTVDSLRDFIIALDKEKADHLRYKVDGDVVKIFITPYRTTISSDDLDFSQGDYNVELVLALGVKDRDDLDSALSAHGRILHDAAVVTVSAGEMKSELGSIDWREENSSSLSEMLVSLSDALKSDKGLLDEQIATAFLTGIVAATDRFSNNRTSSRVMTMAAQLMSAGANQQLIASKLEEANEIGSSTSVSSSQGDQQAKNSDGTTDLSEGESTKVNKKQAAIAEPQADTPKKQGDDGSLVISHNGGEQGAGALSEEQDAAKAAEQNLAEQLATAAPVIAAPTSTLSVADLQKDLANASADVSEAAEKAPPTANAPLPGEQQSNDQPPSMGGTLNATTEQAAEDNRRAVESDRNRTILTHNEGEYVGDQTPTFQSPLNAASQPERDPPMVDPLKETAPSSIRDDPATTYTQAIQPPETTLAEIDQQNRAPHEEARAAVDAAFGAVPFTPAGNPLIGVGAQPLGGEIPHDQPAQASASLPPLPPLPDFSTLPPLPPIPESNAPVGALPPEKLETIFAQGSTNPSPIPQQPTDPGQFKIPGQS